MDDQGFHNPRDIFVCVFISLIFLMRISGINVYVFSYLKETGYLKMGLKPPLLIKEPPVIKDANTTQSKIV